MNCKIQRNASLYIMMNQKLHKRSTTYDIALVTTPLHVSTLLCHPSSGGSCPVHAKLHKHLNAELVIILKLHICFIVNKNI
jgi:hypothetical protein